MNEENTVLKGVKTLIEENERLHKVNDRLSEILDRELDLLKGGDCCSPVAMPARCVKGPSRASTAVKAPKATKATKSPAKPAMAKKVGKTIVRKDGRKFTRTAKVTAARKLQGQYLGRLRHAPNATVKAAAKKLAQTKGVAAAIKALDAIRAGKPFKKAFAVGK